MQAHNRSAKPFFMIHPLNKLDIVMHLCYFMTFVQNSLYVNVYLRHIDQNNF